MTRPVSSYGLTPLQLQIQAVLHDGPIAPVDLAAEQLRVMIEVERAAVQALLLAERGWLPSEYGWHWSAEYRAAVHMACCLVVVVCDWGLERRSQVRALLDATE